MRKDSSLEHFTRKGELEMQADRKGKIAWRGLTLWVRDLPGKEISVSGIHAKFQTLTERATSEHAQVLADGGLWEICNDLIDNFTKVAMAGGKERAKFSLSSPGHYQLYYILFLYIAFDGGIRIGRNLKREINARAKDWNITTEEMHEFSTDFITDLVRLALD